MMTVLEAVIFDVDGTLAETEELHRAAFNDTFPLFDLDWHWSVDLYRDLLRVTGGKERIRHYAATKDVSLADDRVATIHLAKTERYTRDVTAGRCALRPGVEAALKTIRDQGLRLAIATTTSHANVEALITATLGRDGREVFAVVVAGDDVPRKKPAPDVYEATLSRLGLKAGACLAIEDSANGLTAARAAGIETWVTPSLYTAHESFEGAARIMPDLSNFRAVFDERRASSR